jgi:hypothetical protein
MEICIADLNNAEERANELCKYEGKICCADLDSRIICRAFSKL